MSEPVYVKPAEGGRVRQPERRSAVLPATGGYVPRNVYYERLIATGDLVVCDPPAAPSAPKAEAEQSETPSGRGRRAPASQE